GHKTRTSVRDLERTRGIDNDVDPPLQGKPTLAEGRQPRLSVLCISITRPSTNKSGNSTRNTGPAHTKIEPFPGMGGRGASHTPPPFFFPGGGYPPPHVPGQPGATPLPLSGS